MSNENLNLPWELKRDVFQDGDYWVYDAEGIEVNLNEEDIADYIVRAVNTMHQLSEMGIDDPVSWAKKQVDDAFNLGVKHGEELARKDKEIAELKAKLESLNPTDEDKESDGWEYVSRYLQNRYR